nr:immunoglobulin heavy chain junction region [Macaca mulatta]MOX92051.1 immunoglobulin heavy chain junction region [Macaca mulatta]MOX93373.1 immunoglobulin heavy chain junction region [Macaca mulatta]MOX94141.1 immunoglobulin heavy chain junction region [Macaca mulatta]MOX94291.1 immunoglobulin heavy chain junction region [Macaca mulatta]
CTILSPYNTEVGLSDDYW